MRPEAFESALSRLLDGEISPEEFAELEQYLESAVEARAHYWEYVDLHNVLDLELSMPQLVQPGASEVVPVERILTRQRRRSLRISAFAAAALLILLGIVFKLVLIPEPEPLLSFRAAPDSVLSVTHFATDEEVPEPGTLAEGSRLQLTQGTVEFTLSTGVISVVQAPADFTLHRADRLYLNHGTAWFRVPKSGHGFQVQTSDLLVTDLGTEFGVISTREELDEVHVFKGKVEVRSRLGLRNTELLTGNSARIAGPAGRFKTTPVRPEAFLTDLPAGLPHIHFSFDSMEGNQLSVEGSHPDVSAMTARFVHPGKPASSAPLIQGKSGQALRFNGRGDYVETNWPGITGNRPRTVACWVRIPKGVDLTELPAIMGWGDPDGMSAKWKVQVAQESSEDPPVVRVTFGYEWFYGTTRLDDDLWHHLTAIYHGRTAENGLPDVSVYIDGREEPLTPDPNDVRAGYPLPSVDRINDLSIPLIIGKGLVKQDKTFRGLLDELYIFEGVLPEDSIKALIETTPPN